MIIKAHLALFYLKTGEFSLITWNVSAVHDLWKTWWVKQQGHGHLDSLYHSALLKCLAHRRTNSVYTLHCVCEEALCRNNPPLPTIPHIPQSPRLGLQCFCILRWQAWFPREALPIPASPKLRDQATFPSLFGSMPNWFEHSFLISSDSLYSLYGLWRPFARRFSRRPLLLSRGFLFIQIFCCSFSSLSLSFSFLVFSFSPFSPSSPVGPLFSLSKIPFSSPLSVVFRLMGEPFIYLFFGSGKGSPCMYYYFILSYVNLKGCWAGHCAAMIYLHQYLHSISLYWMSTILLFFLSYRIFEKKFNKT